MTITLTGCRRLPIPLPSLVCPHSCFQTPSRLFFVIEFDRGGDYLFHMQSHARFYSTEICLALNYLHEPGIIYRDLKLDIVLLDHVGHVKLIEYEMYASAPATLDYALASTYPWLTLARKLNDSSLD